MKLIAETLEEFINEKLISFIDNVYLMPVDFVIQYCEFDRLDKDKLHNQSYIDNLIKDIESNGIKNPIKLQIYSGKALIIEGNHRVAIAKKIGISQIKVQVIQNNFGSINQHKAKDIDYIPSKWKIGRFE